MEVVSFAAWVTLGVFTTPPQSSLLPRGESLRRHSSSIRPSFALHRNCKTAASLGRRLCLLRILTPIPIVNIRWKRNAARLCGNLLNKASDKRFGQFCIIWLATSIAAFHELTSRQHRRQLFQQRFQFILSDSPNPVDSSFILHRSVCRRFS